MVSGFTKFLDFPKILKNNLCNKIVFYIENVFTVVFTLKKKMRITTSIKDIFKATPQHSISWENV